MKNAILTMLVLCSIGLVQANLLYNGDFETPQAEGWADTGWTSWNWGEGWSEHTNTKTTLQGGNSTFLLNCGNNWEQGGGGAYQTLGATAGVEYTLTVDSAADAWWLPTGAM